MTKPQVKRITVSVSMKRHSLQRHARANLRTKHEQYSNSYMSGLIKHHFSTFSFFNNTAYISSSSKVTVQGHRLLTLFNLHEKVITFIIWDEITDNNTPISLGCSKYFSQITSNHQSNTNSNIKKYDFFKYQIYQVPWNSMEIFWEHEKFHGISWNSGVWNSMELWIWTTFHRIPWIGCFVA